MTRFAMPSIREYLRQHVTHIRAFSTRNVPLIPRAVGSREQVPGTVSVVFVTPNPNGLDRRKIVTAPVGSWLSDIAKQHQVSIHESQGPMQITSALDGIHIELPEAVPEQSPTFMDDRGGAAVGGGGGGGAVSGKRRVNGYRAPGPAGGPDQGIALLLQKLGEQQGLLSKLQADLAKVQSASSSGNSSQDKSEVAKGNAKSSKSKEGEGEADFARMKDELARTRVEPKHLGRRESFADVVGLEDAKRSLRESIVWPATSNSPLFSGIRSCARGLLMYGPPGCGKTMLARAAASELGECASFFYVRPGDIMNKFYGESQKRVQALEEVVREGSPSVVFLDEVDTLLGTRDDSGSGAKHHIATTNALLEWMDGFSGGSEHIFFLGATNRPEAIDEAALRRFGEVVEVGMPSKEGRLALIEHLVTSASKQGHRSAISTQELQIVAECTKGFSLADVDRLVRQAFLQVLRELCPQKVPRLKLEDVPPLMMVHFQTALKQFAGTSNLSAKFKLANHSSKVQSNNVDPALFFSPN